MTTRLTPAALALLALLLLGDSPSARQPRTLQPEDYGRWENLSAQRTPLSPDGRWLVYGVTRASRQNELRVQESGGGGTVTLPFAEQPAFSDDSRWLVYLTGFSEEEEAKRRKDKKPLHKTLGMRELATGRQTTVDGIESFSLSPTGTHVAMRRYGPEPREGGGDASAGAEAQETIAPGTTLIVRDLATGRDTTFGSVSETAWRDNSATLAMAVTVEGGVGNGVQLFDAVTGTLRVLDSSSSTYSGLAWRKDAASLAVLRSSASDTREGPTHVALAWPDAAAAPQTRRELDPASASLAADLRVVRFRAPRWSDDGRWLFVGVGPWREKAAAGSAASRRVTASSTNPDEMPDVQVWHPKDAIVMPKQKIDARRDRERSMLAAWAVDEGRLVRIAAAMGEEATPIRRSSRVLVVDTAAFAMERSIGRVLSNVSVLDLATGARTTVGQRLEDRYVQSSPGGKYVLYLKNDHYWTVDLATGRQTNITASVATSFIEKDSDDTVDQKPPYGGAGWTSDDRALLLYDKLDVWEVKADGSGATRLTNGTAGEVRHRYVRLDPEEEWIDRSRPLYLSQFGMKSKKSGYARLSGDPKEGVASTTTAPNTLVFLDKRVDRLAKAKRADRFVYAAQDFDDSPDYFSADGTLGNAVQVTATNPFMSDYAWGRSAIVEYRNAQGVPMQGALFYPAGYEAGKKYPMVVYMYERLSDGVHAFSTPSERDVYNPAAFTTRGYVLFQPDIVFRPREPGLSVVDCVVPAVKRVIEMGIADPARVGIVGHSWGGFDTVVLATHTDVFAAAVAGAPITDLVSNYGNHHWSSGIAETDHIETGQQRMQVPLYEDLQAYIRNSAIYKAHTMKTPLLLMTGDNDGTVHWHQAVALYNIARRAGKNAVLLQYGAEDHGLRKRANQIDYHHRIHEWFDHYLKGAAATAWISDGERFLDRERDLRQRKTPAKPAPTTTAAPQARP